MQFITKDLIPRNALTSIELMYDSTCISFKEMQSSKADLLIVFNEEGNEIFSNEEHFLKAEDWIVWMEDGKIISINDEHSSNADSEITVMPSGIDTFGNDLHPEKA